MMRHAAFNLLALLGAFLGAAVLLCLQSRADDAITREDQLKAAYLINFVQFVQWPGAADDTFTVCFHGADGVREALAQAIAHKKRVGGGGVLAVRALTPNTAVDGCRVLFIDSAAGMRMLDPADKPVLTVSDASEFARSGGMIELFTENNRLRFNINVDSAHRAGLQISSHLLQLAAAVQRGGSP